VTNCRPRARRCPADGGRILSCRSSRQDEYVGPGPSPQQFSRAKPPVCGNRQRTWGLLCGSCRQPIANISSWSARRSSEGVSLRRRPHTPATVCLPFGDAKKSSSGAPGTPRQSGESAKVTFQIREPGWRSPPRTVCSWPLSRGWARSGGSNANAKDAAAIRVRRQLLEVVKIRRPMSGRNQLFPVRNSEM